MRAVIAEPARYYHGERCIVIRQGMLIEDERRFLWHELVHADRGDLACHTNEAVERSVEREAVRRAVPTESLLATCARADSWHDLADVLKLPESWVRFRLSISPPWERELIRREV